MLFSFLRKYLKDDEFERTEVELAETKAVLKEYKDFIEQQKHQEKDEKEKVDSDFLTLIWASIGFAIAIFIDAGKSLIEILKSGTYSWPFYIWSVVLLFSVAFIAGNTTFALELTVKYAKSKSHGGYKQYAYYVVIGIILLTASAFGLAYLK